ncbi:MAG: hypothetical protein HQM08_18885 [Candidatus Riflebacteria bacterium]|nr:hypothetical protein [Candidatus Riflebacteria bacterium]
MNPKLSEERLFFEIAVKLGYISSEKSQEVLEKQKIDKAIGVEKPIGSYLFEEKHLSREQISDILRKQEELYSQKDVIVKTEPITKIDPSSVSLNTGEGIELGYCLHCGQVPVKVTKTEKDYAGCGLGCLGVAINLFLYIVSVGSWGFFHVSYMLGMWLFETTPNDRVNCLKCGAIIKH